MHAVLLTGFVMYRLFAQDVFQPLKESAVEKATQILWSSLSREAAADGLTEDQRRSATRVSALLAAREVYWARSRTSSPTGDLPSAAEAGVALPVLRQMVQSDDPATRQRGLEALGQSPDSGSLELVLGSLRDPSPEVRETAAKTLAQFDEETVFRRVLDMLCDHWPDTATDIGDALPPLKESLETRMLETLDSAEESVLRKAAAAYALGCMRSANARDLLAASAWSSDAVLAVTSANALAAVADGATVGCFGQLLQHPLVEVRWAAVEGLAAAGTPEAVSLLGRVAADAKEENRPLQERAVELLGKAPSEAAVPALVEAMRVNLYIRRQAAEALRRQTGQDFGEKPADWAAWYAQQLPPPTPPLVQGVLPPPPLEEAITPPSINLELPNDGSPEP